MKNKITITINGQEYPCYQTMGALLRFKQETGKDLSEADGGVYDSAVFLWCCVVSACKREGKEFNMSLMDFADAIDVDDMNRLTEQTEPSEEKDEEKKSL